MAPRLHFRLELRAREHRVGLNVGRSTGMGTPISIQLSFRALCETNTSYLVDLQARVVQVSSYSPFKGVTNFPTMHHREFRWPPT